MIDTYDRDRTSLNEIELIQTKNTVSQEQNRTAVVKNDLINRNPINFSIQNDQEHLTASNYNDGIRSGNREDIQDGNNDGIGGGNRENSRGSLKIQA